MPARNASKEALLNELALVPPHCYQQSEADGFFKKCVEGINPVLDSTDRSQLDPLNYCSMSKEQSDSWINRLP